MRRMAMALAGALALLEGAAMAKTDDGADVGASTNTVVLQERIKELEKEVARLNSQIKTQRYGLVWLDVPEAFEKESENAIPILEEDKSKAIRNDDGKPTHILIEGDNYHALTCLNYTHRGKIDVIYIDPPYNTGNGDFIYKDKRKLDKYPDGEPIKPDSPLRHSTWLSFMEKRLKLAKTLLSDRGVIFISIDDNEQAQLKLLCDKIFGEENFIGDITWESTTQPTNAGTALFQLQKKVEFIICYAKCNTRRNAFKLREVVSENKYPHKGKFGACRFEVIEKSDTGRFRRNTMKFKILGHYPREGKRWQIGEETARDLERRGRVEIVNGIVKKAVYPEDENNVSFIPFWSHFGSEIGTALKAKKELNAILGESTDFETVKPIDLIAELIYHVAPSTTVLDFFAGSGTTMHAVMKLNAEDGGKRQCILVNNNENEICEKVTYERNRRVIQGYRDPKGCDIPGLGNSLKYYRTAFVGENEAAKASDEDREALSRKAGCLLGLAENTLEETASGRCWQVFTDGKDRMTGVYFSGDAGEMGDFVSRLEAFRDASRLNRVAAYFFCWDDASSFANEFRSTKRIDVKPIPEPILKVYKELNK